jgi:hypothetical protein
MESRRLVVWISAGILGFQGATLAFDLLNCTVLSMLFVRQHGLGVVVAPLREQKPGGVGAPVGPAGPQGAAGGAGSGPGGLDIQEGSGEPQAQGNTSGAAQAPPPALQPAQRPQQAPQPSQGPAPTVSAFDPTGVFCAQPRSRIDDAVSQGLTILAGLALGSSVGGGGRSGGGGP